MASLKVLFLIVDLSLHQVLENILWVYKCGVEIIVDFPPLDMGNGQT
jgi:hypothetical protein